MTDRVAIIAILLSVVSITCGRNARSSSSVDERGEGDFSSEFKRLSYEQRQGRHVYLKFCAVCHGAEGKGDGFNSYNLDPKPRDFTDSSYMKVLSDKRLFDTISEGGRGVNKSPLMPSWGETVSKEDITYLIEYIKVFPSDTSSSK